MFSRQSLKAQSSVQTRFEPFTPAFFDDVFDEVYPVDEKTTLPNPHRLALVFAVFAFSELLEHPTLSLNAAARYHARSRLCLALGDYLNEVSIASLCTIHLDCSYVLNAEGHLDELYVLVGLGLRLATVAGFHRGEGARSNRISPPCTE